MIIGIEPLLRIEIVLLLRECLAGFLDRILRGLLGIAARREQKCTRHEQIFCAVMRGFLLSL